MRTKILLAILTVGLMGTLFHFQTNLYQNLKTQVLISINEKENPRSELVQNYNYEIISQDKSTVKLDPNEEKNLEIILQNIGKNSWDLSENSENPLFLKSIFPNGANSNIYASKSENWQSPALYKIHDKNGKTEIKTNDTITFEFKISSPKNAGYYKEKFGLLIENKKLLRTKTLDLDILVEGDYSDSYSYEYVDPIMKDNYLPNKEKTQEIKLKNTGKTPWYKSGNYKTYLEENGTKTETELSEYQVNPGEEGTFLVKTVTPSSIGSYEKQFVFKIKNLIAFDSSPVNFEMNITNKKVALTFDDGYGEIDPFIDTLNKHNVKATFFMLGVVAQHQPEQMRRIIADGHRLANHSYNHPDFRTLTHDEVVWQIEETRNIMKNITGFDVLPYFRYPYGAFNDYTNGIVEGNGWKWIHWTNGTGDYQHHQNTAVGRHQVYFYSTLNPPETSIVLMHIISKSTLGTLPEIIQWYREHNYAFVTVDEL
ncbi:MAG: polysaccharide deacetylase family protein [Candidatus Peregrinibacteria bacterium]|nr:polysaccharide deacetylase family protein [Candidatus Peregrinibacteria bacterium]